MGIKVDRKDRGTVKTPVFLCGILNNGVHDYITADGQQRFYKFHTEEGKLTLHLDCREVEESNKYTIYFRTLYKIDAVTGELTIMARDRENSIIERIVTKVSEGDYLVSVIVQKEVMLMM